MQSTSTSRQIMPPNKCSFCSHTGVYRCSRCYRWYCSRDCFKCSQHSQCSELFFKNCVEQHLNTHRFDESAKKKILDILKRSAKFSDSTQFNDTVGEEEEDDIEANDEALLENRFSELDITDADVSELWKLLSDSEKTEFDLLLQNGSIGQYVDLWKPWWRYRPKLVQEIDSENSEKTANSNRNEFKPKLPELHTNISRLSELTSKTPSVSICPSIISTLLGYCYICRLFNGDYYSLESLQALIACCPQLSRDINCDDLHQSLQMCIQHIMQSQPKEFIIELLGDIKCMISGPKLMLERCETPNYAVRALSDLIHAINNVKALSERRVSRALRLDLLAKKFEFYISWCLECGSKLFDSLPQIDEEMVNLMCEEKKI